MACHRFCFQLTIIQFNLVLHLFLPVFHRNEFSFAQPHRTCLSQWFPRKRHIFYLLLSDHRRNCIFRQPIECLWFPLVHMPLLSAKDLLDGGARFCGPVTCTRHRAIGCLCILYGQFFDWPLLWVCLRWNIQHRNRQQMRTTRILTQI